MTSTTVHAGVRAVHTTTIESPVGPITLRGVDTADGFALTGLWMVEHRHGPQDAERAGWTRDDRPFAETARQLSEYFGGDRQQFDLRLAAAGTPFQQQVWAVLATIPYGETRSYLDVAQALGAPSAVRAVGAANGRNPISIVVPCHRVVGADGSMTGYGGGVERKRWLLGHERAAAGSSLF